MRSVMHISIKGKNQDAIQNWQKALDSGADSGGNPGSFSQRVSRIRIMPQPLRF
jgi:hypothetical protein